jgi:hypothetical protein
MATNGLAARRRCWCTPRAKNPAIRRLFGWTFVQLRIALRDELHLRLLQGVSGIDRVKDGGVANGQPNLVSLQLPDEMPWI